MAAPRSRRSNSPNRAMLALIGVAVVGFAILIAVLSTGESESAVSVDDIAQQVDVRGEPLVTFGGDPATDSARGRPAPVLDGSDFDGREISVGDGEPTLISFMASWCPACQQELPELVAWLDEGRLPEGVELVVVSTGLDAGRPNWPPDVWLEEEGYNGPILVDDGSGTAARALGLNATPFWVAIDGDGTVVLRLAGMLSGEQLDEVAALLAAA